MSVSFTSGSVNWHSKEKKLIFFLVALEKARDLLRNLDGFYMLTDHKNLVYFFGSRQDTGSSACKRSIIQVGFGSDVFFLYCGAYGW